MDYLNHLQNWTKGEVFQGKLMLLLAFFTLLILVLIFKSEHALLKGMMIPLGILLLINVGYGSFITFKRPVELKTSITQYQENREVYLQQAFEKAKLDDKNYTMIKRFWAVLLVVSLIAFFFVSKEYYLGLSLGFMVFFVVALLIDSLLHHRLKTILNLLTDLTQ